MFNLDVFFLFFFLCIYSSSTSNNQSITNNSSSALSPLRTQIPKQNYISDLNSPLIQVRVSIFAQQMSQIIKLYCLLLSFAVFFFEKETRKQNVFRQGVQRLLFEVCIKRAFRQNWSNPSIVFLWLEILNLCKGFIYSPINGGSRPI